MISTDITCPVLDSGTGILTCSQSSSPVTCSYQCPDNLFLLSEGDLVTSQMVKCDPNTAQWSHVSLSNSLGSFPPCTGELVKCFLAALTIIH